MVGKFNSKEKKGFKKSSTSESSKKGGEGIIIKQRTRPPPTRQHTKAVERSELEHKGEKIGQEAGKGGHWGEGVHSTNTKLGKEVSQ